MKTFLMVCLLAIWWQSNCNFCNPIGFKTDHVRRGIEPQPKWEAFKYSTEAVGMSHPPHTSPKLNGVKPANTNPFSEEPREQTPLLIESSSDHLPQLTEVKANGFLHQTSEDRPIGRASPGSSHKSDETAETPAQPTQVFPETKDGLETASEKQVVTEPQTEKTPAGPGVTKAPENSTSGTKKPWHSRVWQRVSHWMNTSPSLAARTTKLLVRWLSLNKPKRKTAEEVKKEKETKEIEKQIELLYKVREREPTLLINPIEEDKKADAPPINAIANEPEGIAQDLKGLSKASDEITNQPNGIAKEPKRGVKEPNDVVQKEVDKEYERVRHMVYKVILELAHWQENKGENGKQDHESQQIVQLLQKLTPLPANGHETKTA